MQIISVIAFLFGLIGVPYVLWAQEVVVRAGDTRETGRINSSHTYAYGFSYFQGVGEDFAWSVGYLNEGISPSTRGMASTFSSGRELTWQTANSRLAWE
jgi:hypothetical protein